MMRNSKKSRKSMGKSRRSTVGFNEFQMTAVSSQDVLKRLGSTHDFHKSKAQGYANRLLMHHAFEYSMGLVILTNIFVMVIEIDRSTKEEEGYQSDGAVHWTEVFGWVVLLIFALELCLRLFAFRRNFFMDAWNIFDFIIVCTDITVFFTALLFGKIFPVTILRIFRLAKLARISKVLRVFPELRLLLASLISSISAIFWGAILLFLVLLGWSMVAVLFIHPLNKHIEYEDCERCYRAYSSVMHSALTFWQQIVAGDSWGKVTIPLIEKHPSTALFFIPLFLTVGMAVVSLILGMVVSVAQQAKEDLREVDNAQASAVKLERQSNLLKLCKEMDVDHDGEVSHEELLTGFEEPGEFRDSMEALGITREDFDVVWAIMDSDNSGSVSYKRLVSRLYGMKTSDSQFTLAYLKYHITLIRDALRDMEDESHHEEHRVKETLKGIQEKEDILLERQDMVLECQEALLQQFQKSAPGEHCNGLRSNGLDPEVTKGEDIQMLIQKLLLVLEEEPDFWGTEVVAAGDDESEAARKSGEPQVQEPINKKSNGLQKYSSTNLHGSQGDLDDTHCLLKKVGRDIKMLRLEVKDAFRNLDCRPGSKVSALSAMERDILGAEAQLDLLVVPEKASSCSLFPRCNGAKPRTEIHALDVLQ